MTCIRDIFFFSSTDFNDSLPLAVDSLLLSANDNAGVVISWPAIPQSVTIEMPSMPINTHPVTMFRINCFVSTRGCGDIGVP